MIIEYKNGSFVTTHAAHPTLKHRTVCLKRTHHKTLRNGVSFAYTTCACTTWPIDCVDCILGLADKKQVNNFNRFIKEAIGKSIEQIKSIEETRNLLFDEFDSLSKKCPFNEGTRDLRSRLGNGLVPCCHPKHKRPYMPNNCGAEYCPLKREK